MRPPRGERRCGHQGESANMHGDVCKARIAGATMKLHAKCNFAIIIALEHVQFTQQQRESWCNSWSVGVSGGERGKMEVLGYQGEQALLGGSFSRVKSAHSVSWNILLVCPLFRGFTWFLSRAVSHARTDNSGRTVRLPWDHTSPPRPLMPRREVPHRM